MKINEALRIISLEKKEAEVRMKAPFGGIRADENLNQRITERLASQAMHQKNDNVQFDRVEDVLPKEEDFIYVDFRALSKTVIQGHWLDWTRDGVLEDGVSLLQNQTVFANHVFWDVEKWLGSVNKTSWDATGENFGNVPGINAQYKIDALMNPRIARGLLMKPPAIHSTSLTVLFEFEYSHPRLADEGKFWMNLGEEIDGEIVCMIVTKIREIWEASLVFQGADRLAKQMPETVGGDEDLDSFSAASLSVVPTNSNEEKEKTMKLNKEQKAKLGIEFDGEDVPETEILKAAETLAAKNKDFDGVNLTELQAKAGQVDTLMTRQRAEVVRLAKLAELGADEAELDDIVSQQIEDADADKLVKLETYYQKKAADRFPGGRTSQEASDDVETAGGVKTEGQPNKVSVGGLV